MEAKLHSLDEIFALALAHDFYRERLQGCSNFAQAPVTDKKMLYELVTARLNKDGENKGIYLSPTGGSIANQLLFFPTSIQENIFQRQVLARYLNEAGIFKDAVAINLFGSNMLYRSLEIFNYFVEAADATTLPFSSNCDDASVYSLSTHFRANTIMGMPSRLMQFAQYMRDELNGGARPSRDKLKIDHIIFAGESLNEYKRDYLFETFGASKLSAIFGSAEAGIWAYKPFSAGSQAAANEGFFYPLEMMHVEVLDPDAAGFGRLVLTNLIRSRNPLLRYDCGDKGRISIVDYQGKTMGKLEFAGRAANSFQIGGNYFDISEFSEVTGSLLDFQIELVTDRDSGKDRLHFLAASEDEVRSQSAKDSLAETLRNILQSNEDFLISADIVPMKALTRSRTSGKVIKVLDRR